MKATVRNDNKIRLNPETLAEAVLLARWGQEGIKVCTDGYWARGMDFMHALHLDIEFVDTHLADDEDEANGR